MLYFGIQNFMYFIFAWVLFFFLCALFLDFYGSQSTEIVQYDAIVVLGCKIQTSGKISFGLQGRVDLAAKIFKNGHAPILIFTGGRTTSSLSEAQVAQAYVMDEYQIRIEKLRLEEHSKNTEENAIYTKKLYKNINKILVVTDSFHVYRGQKVFEKYFDQLDGIGWTSSFYYRTLGSLREVLAVIKYKAVGDI